VGVTKQPERAVWRTGGALFVAQVVSGGLGVLAWLLAAFNYSAQDVGTALALVGALSWAGLIGNLGLGSTVVALWAGDRPSARAALAATAVRVACGAAGALALVVGIGLRYGNGALGEAAAQPWVLASLIVGGAAWAAGVVLDHVAVAGQRAGIAVERSLVSGLSRLALLGVAITMSADGAAALVAGWAAAAVAGSVVAAVRLRVAGLLGPVSDEGPTAPALAREGLRTHHIVNLFGQTPPMLLPVVIAARSGGEAAGAFGAAWQIASTVGLLSPAIATGLFAAASAQRDNLANRSKTTTRHLVAIVAVATAVLIVAGPKLLGLVGDEYHDGGTTALRFLAVALIADAVTNVEVARLRVLRQFGRAIALNALIAVAAVAGAFALAGGYGGAGAAAAWCGAQAVGVVATRLGAIRDRRRPAHMAPHFPLHVLRREPPTPPTSMVGERVAI
jgi:O-antigen/teichoic acid export membrane protein